MDETAFMKKAIELADKGRGYTSPNPIVGAVVVKDGNIVGRGYHQYVGGAHAEVNAIEDAGSLAKDSTLYVTLEPCNHTGRTPPCTKKILDAGIKRVVVAMDDPNTDVTGGGIEYLKQHGVDVLTGICENDAKRQNEIFLKYVKTKLPFVLVKCAATLDGRIATRTGEAKWVTGEESRKYVHRLRHEFDAIMVGIDTVVKDNPSLTTRLGDGKGLDPVRVILDTKLTISEEARVLRLDSDSATLIICGDAVPLDRKERIEGLGARVVKSPIKDGLIDLGSLMEQLGAMDITSLLIEGGSRVIAESFASGIVNKIAFFYAPKILGGDDGVPVCKGPGPAMMEECIKVRDMNVKRFGEDVLIEGYIDCAHS